MGEVIALPLAGSAALPDVRGQHRALQVTWHAQDRVFVVSTWRFGRCVASVRLDPVAAGELVGTIADGLARAASPGIPLPGPADPPTPESPEAAPSAPHTRALGN